MTVTWTLHETTAATWTLHESEDISWVVLQGVASASAGFDGEHNDLDGRTAPDAHPMAAITGLEEALENAGGGAPGGGGGGGFGLASPERIGVRAIQTVAEYDTGLWDDQSLREPGQAIYDPVTEQWIITYTGRGTAGFGGSIGAVLSSDGETWAAHPQNPIVAEQPVGWFDNDLASEDPYLAKNLDGTLYRDESGRALMFCEEKDYATHHGVTLFRSAPGTLSDWTLVGQALEGGYSYSGPAGAWDETDRTSPTVVWTGEFCVMLYEGRNLSDEQWGSVGFAVGSSDGESFIPAAAPLITPQPDSWYSSSIVPDDLIFVNGAWVLTCHGSVDEVGFSIGRFITTVEPGEWDEDSWTEMVGNPFTTGTNTLMCWGNDPTQALWITPNERALERLLVGPDIGLGGGGGVFDPSGLQGQIDTLDGRVDAIEVDIDALEADVDPNEAGLLVGRAAVSEPVAAFTFDTGDFGGEAPGGGSDYAFPDARIETVALPWTLSSVGAGVSSPMPPATDARLVGVRVKLSTDGAEELTDIGVAIQFMSSGFLPFTGGAYSTTSGWSALGPDITSVVGPPLNNESEVVFLLADPILSPAAGDAILFIGFGAGDSPDVGAGAALVLPGEGAVEWLWDRDGGDLADGSVTNATVAADAAVDLSKLQTINTARLLGRTASGTGPIEQLDAAAVRSALGLWSATRGAGSPVADTTTDTSLLPSPITLPALATGDAIEFDAVMTYRNTSGANRAPVVRVKVGATAILAVTLSLFSSSAGATLRAIHLRGHIRSSGAGAQTGGASAIARDSGAGFPLVAGAADGVGTEAMQTAGLAFDISCQHPTADSLQTMTLQSLIVRKVLA